MNQHAVGTGHVPGESRSHRQVDHEAGNASDAGRLQRVVRLAPHRSVVLLLFVLLIGAACGSTADLADSTGGSPNESETAVRNTAPIEAIPVTVDDDQDSQKGPLRSSGNSDYNIADKITALPPAKTGLPFAAPPGPVPVGLTIDALGLSTAGVIGVGVEENGDMEIPPADRVGWYRFGASPGDEVGSAVLAAHIAFDGQDGVFVNLDELEIGSLIQVEYSDGSVAEFVASAKEQYDKNELPKSSIFDRSGDPQLVLITCGGDFNSKVRSYEDNVVVYAKPLGKT